jgi:hypothetical protein
MSTENHDLLNEEITKVSISLPVKLKERIELAAKQDRRTISNFLQVTLLSIFSEKGGNNESANA